MTLQEKNEYAKEKLQRLRVQSNRVRYKVLTKKLNVSDSWISKWFKDGIVASEAQIRIILEYILVEEYILNEINRLQAGELTKEELRDLGVE